MRKKIRILFLALMSLLILSGCGKSSTVDEGNVPQSGGTESEVSLCRVYYFDKTNLELKYVEKELDKSADNFGVILGEELKEKVSDDVLPLSIKVSVDKVEVDERDNAVKVYFNDDFTKYMDLGTNTESGLVNAIIATYGYNYGVKRVSIYFGDELYSGLKGDSSPYFEVSYKNSYKMDDTEADENEDVKIVIYDGVKDSLVYKNVQYRMTNENKAECLADILNNSGFNGVIEVESVSLDEENDTLYLNLTDKYYEILTSVGSGSESGNLKSIAYTYGLNYNVSKVVINIGGKPYSGSHIEFEEGEYIELLLENVINE